MVKLTALTSATLLLLPSLALGQSGPSDPPDRKKKQQTRQTEDERQAYERRKAEIRRRIQTYRAMMKKGEVLRTHVTVRVNLRNDEQMSGVVRDGLFIEKPSGLEFVRAEMTTEGAGLRLWYYDQTDGFIFIPYTLIKTYKILKRLSEVEVKEIRDKIVEQGRLADESGADRRQQLAQRQQELREGANTEAKLAEVSKSLEAERKAKERERELQALLQEFPPAEGWGAERIREIDQRRIAVKVFPNPKERRFIEVFDDWKEAHRIWLEQQEKAKSEAESKAKSEAEGGAKPKQPEKVTEEKKAPGVGVGAPPPIPPKR